VIEIGVIFSRREKKLTARSPNILKVVKIGMKAATFSRLSKTPEKSYKFDRKRRFQKQ
jgi:hypothetical protein